MTQLLSRNSHRAALTAAAATAMVLVSSASAGAHVEATAEGAQAGAGPVVTAFTVEAESSTAGIAGVKTQLPAGLPPSSVSLASGPDGWVLTPTSDGYEVAGPAIATGVDAEFGVTIAELPADAAPETPFKTLVRYSDGTEDAWIELPTADSPEPANPAPAITVAPAAAPSAPTTTPLSPSASPTAEPTTQSDAEPLAATDDDSSSTGLVIGAVAVVVALAGAALWFRRRQSSGS